VLGHHTKNLEFAVIPENTGKYTVTVSLFFTSESIKMDNFEIKKANIFWGGGLAPSPGSYPSGEDTPSPNPTPLGAFGASTHAPSPLIRPPNCIIFLEV